MTYFADLVERHGDALTNGAHLRRYALAIRAARGVAVALSLPVERVVETVQDAVRLAKHRPDSMDAKVESAL